MKQFIKIGILFLLALGCENNTEIPLPSNPLITFALPQSIFTITVTPNPMPQSETTQTWSITETNSVDFDITDIRYRVYDQSDNYTREYVFEKSEILSVFEYVYIPPCTTITGTRTNDFTDPPGHWAAITVSGIDENQNLVSSADTVLIE